VISLNIVLLFIGNRKNYSIYIRPIKTVSNKNRLEHKCININIVYTGPPKAPIHHNCVRLTEYVYTSIDDVIQHLIYQKKLKEIRNIVISNTNIIYYIAPHKPQMQKKN